MNKKKLVHLSKEQPPIGVIGCNSPHFLKAHEPFIERVKNSVLARGGCPLFMGISGSMESPHSNGNRGFHYGLPSRDMIADQIELILYNEGLKGLILIPWSINSLVGMVMAIARSNIPATFLPQYSLWSDHWNDLSYTDCSMPIHLEVLGLTQSGSFENVFHKDRVQFDETPSLEWGAQRILELVKGQIPSNRFINSASLHNSLCVDLALGGSSETYLHLAAIAREANLTLPGSWVNELSKKIGPLVPLNREGEFKIEDLKKMGGLAALLCTLSPFLQRSLIGNGRDIVESAKKLSAGKSHFKSSHTHSEQSVAALSGTLAREGALFRVAPLKSDWYSYSGPVKVFNTEELCVKAISSKKIKKGDILVLRYCGPRGNPGMAPLKRSLEVLREKGLEEAVALLTDGRISKGGKTPTIVHISPEAAVGGPLSIIQDGDIIQWNLEEKSLHLRLTDTEIRVRLSRWREQDLGLTQSLLARYLKYSSSSALGAILK